MSRNGLFTGFRPVERSTDNLFGAAAATVPEGSGRRRRASESPLASNFSERHWSDESESMVEGWYARSRRRTVVAHRVATLREIEGRLLAVMPLESTIDRPLHALAVASVVFEARRRASGITRDEIAKTRAHLEMTGDLARLLRLRMEGAS